MQRIELRLDVSAAVPLAGRHEVAMTAYLPPADALGPRPVAIFASPGGGYTRHYYDMQPPGHAGYSEAEAHVRQGFIFVSYDHLGVGDSCTAQLREYTVPLLAAANDAAVCEVAPLRKTAPAWGSLTVPPCAVTMMTPGVVAADAASVKVPVLIAMGERDVCPDPHAEPSAYKGSNDVSLFIAPRMAHMHNFASTRAVLWSRIESWSRRVAAGQPL